MRENEELSSDREESENLFEINENCLLLLSKSINEVTLSLGNSTHLIYEVNTQTYGCC